MFPVPESQALGKEDAANIADRFAQVVREAKKDPKHAKDIACKFAYEVQDKAVEIAVRVAKEVPIYAAEIAACIASIVPDRAEEIAVRVVAIVPEYAIII